MKRRAGKRKLRNFVLAPEDQLRTGMYTLSFLVSISTILILYLFIRRPMFEEILATCREDGAIQLVYLVKQYFIYWTALILVSCGTGLFVGFLVTHRMVGPMVPISRHIQALIEGNYKSRVHLRKGDAFQEVAKKLNALAEALDKK